MRRVWDINLIDPDRFQIIIDTPRGKDFIRTSVMGVNYVADFIERFEEVYRRKARILEYGDGVSTIWFAKNFPDNELYSIGGEKGWFDLVEEHLKTLNHKVTHIYRKASNQYTTELDPNFKYAHVIDEINPPFDVIINDGAQREIIGDYILSNADKYISPGGIFLRHDYEMAVLGNWVGLRDKLPAWCRDKLDLGYEGFASTHPEYAVVTTTGNGLAGNVMEYGGIWRKVDHQWKRKLDQIAEAEKEANDNH